MILESQDLLIHPDSRLPNAFHFFRWEEFSNAEQFDEKKKFEMISRKLAALIFLPFLQERDTAVSRNF